MNFAPSVRLFPRMVALLGAVAAPATPVSAMGSMSISLARRRDYEAYEALWREGLVAIGVPPSPAPDGLAAFYGEWSYELWCGMRPLVRLGAFTSGTRIAVTRSGWDFLLDAMRQRLWHPEPPTWAATAIQRAAARVEPPVVNRDRKRSE